MGTRRLVGGRGAACGWIVGTVRAVPGLARAGKVSADWRALARRGSSGRARLAEDEARQAGRRRIGQRRVVGLACAGTDAACRQARPGKGEDGSSAGRGCWLGPGSSAGAGTGWLGTVGPAVARVAGGLSARCRFGWPGLVGKAGSGAVRSWHVGWGDPVRPGFVTGMRRDGLSARLGRSCAVLACRPGRQSEGPGYVGKGSPGAGELLASRRGPQWLRSGGRRSVGVWQGLCAVAR